ncbi:NYN domain-containing protein [Caulobacter radicis]|uniref:NYN domain-containing protein n=1 Tax=Caulobacter radicis TaxID=2172650 RepID=UPI000D5810C2|nr:NYN domain-containing protein [Caulobacter radicis]PVM89271.1 NYN domain-containing protein [Caulobacter radicis]
MTLQVADAPAKKRAIVFIDGQNLYHCAREAYSCTHPNYDPLKLARLVCEKHGWLLKQVRFYTGYPKAEDDPFWANFWQKKLLAISRQGVKKFSRPLRYRKKTIKLKDGSEIETTVGEEKGVDVRIAIDVIRCALDAEYDVAVLFTQDQDLSEATDEVKKIARQFDRAVEVACAYPVGPGTTNARGINGTQWIKLSREEYDACIDPADYR